MDVTYLGSDGQRHYARVLIDHHDGTVTIRRGYYDPMDGTRTTFLRSDDVRDFRTGAPITFPVSPFVRRALARELPGKVVA